MKILRLNYLVFLTILVLAMILSQGCGRKTETAPDESTVTFNPTSFTYKAPATICLSPIDVIVRYSDGTPFPKATVNISGGFAVPNVDPVSVTSGGLYQFYSAPNCGGVAVNSGFQAQTDVKGVYSFSIVIFGVISGQTTTGLPYTDLLNSFTDKLVATSGTAVGTADFKFN